MRTRAILRLLAALSVFALLATACGDDDTTTAGDDPDGEVSDDTAGDDTATDDTATDDMTHDDSHGSTDDMGGDDMGGDDMAHVDHGTVDVAADGAPEVDIEVFADPAGGVNIHVLTENYAITPRAASTEHVEGEGGRTVGQRSPGLRNRR